MEQNRTIFYTAHYERWKIDHVRQKCTKKIVVEARWSFANGGKARINAKKSDAVCVRWDWKGIVHYKLLPSDQTIDSNLYCQQLERLHQIERKRSELINREGIVFHHNARFLPPTHLWRLVKNWEKLVGKFWCIHLIILTLHHQITICFDLYRAAFGFHIRMLSFSSYLMSVSLSL